MSLFETFPANAFPQKSFCVITANFHAPDFHRIPCSAFGKSTNSKGWFYSLYRTVLILYHSVCSFSIEKNKLSKNELLTERTRRQSRVLSVRCGNIRGIECMLLTFPDYAFSGYIINSFFIFNKFIAKRQPPFCFEHGAQNSFKSN